jgi:hypothetical protein
MKKPADSSLPVVFRQRWVLVLPDGRVYDDGVSYHLTESDRNAMVQGMADRLSTAVDEPLHEPVGDPEPVHVGREYYQKLLETQALGGFGIRLVDMERPGN